MMFEVKKQNRITGGIELVIEPIFKDFYEIDRIRIKYTDDLKIIKEKISNIFDEEFDNIILV